VPDPLNIIALISLLLLLLAWVVYPLVVTGLALLLDTGSNPNESMVGKRVSVVIATREDAPDVWSRVEDVLRTTYPRELIEVIVARDAAAGALSEGTSVCCGARVQVVPGDAPGGKAAALNAGVRVATGEVLIFADTHQRFDVNAIPRLVAALEDPRTGAVSGRLVLPLGTAKRSLIERYWALEWRLRRSEARIHSAVGVSGAIYAVRRSLWQPLPTGLILDDLYLPMRLLMLGYRIGFADDALAWEVRHSAIAHEYRRKVRTLTGNLQLCAWLPAVLLPVRNPIWIQFVCHKLLRLLTPYALLAVAVWSALASWLALDTNARATALGVAVLLFALLLFDAKPTRSLRSLLYEGAALQVALVTATLNGLRGRWDVWHR
jgi:cellulose synthase/poly-beta-1,6-N-acetylglucosamine synthase-like glycosyltransferase